MTSTRCNDHQPVRWIRWGSLACLAVVLALPAHRIGGKAWTLNGFEQDYSWELIDGFYHYAGGDPESLSSRIDADDISYYDYGGATGRQYNPVTASQLVLSLIADRDEPRARAVLFRNLEALVRRGETTTGGNLVFPYEFDFPLCNEKAPWYSGMAQGQAASALLWGYRISSDDRYLLHAKRAILALLEDEYKLLRTLEQGCWVEEFPGYHLTVLDGSLAAIAGIYDLFRSLDDDDPDKPVVRELLDNCMAGFKNNSQVFDCPYAGHYFDDGYTLPNQGYHRSNLAWLSYLADYDPELMEIRERYAGTRNLVGNISAATIYYLVRTPEKVGLLKLERQIR